MDLGWIASQTLTFLMLFITIFYLFFIHSI